MGSISFQLALIVLLTLANGFFAASEIAVVSARRGRLQQRAEAGSTRAGAALRLAGQPNHFLATVQVGISLIGTFAAAFGGDVLSEPLAVAIAPVVGPTYAPLAALVIVVLGLTYLSLILGELVPKRLALQRAEGVAMFVAPIMERIARVAAPVVWVLSVSTQAVLRLLGRATAKEEVVTEDDVLSLVREGAEAGTLEAAEQELIKNVFDFTDCTAREIMTPRTALAALPVDTPLGVAVEQVLESGYSRIPIYENTPDTIVGILHVKDLLRTIHQPRAGDPPALREILRPATFTPEHQHIAALLQQFRQTRTHLAVVVDEYGQTDGVVTLEDVLEELTGDIADEHDEIDAMVITRTDGSFLVDGRLGYADAVDRLDLPPRSTITDLAEFDTVAGLLLCLLEHIPTTGETVGWRGWQFEIVDMDGVRIDKVLAHPPDHSAQARDEGALAMGAVLPPVRPDREA